MARFEGTNREFKHYVGAQLRVVVQKLTAKQKAAVGACEHCGCGSNENLESAHIRGRDRTDIIDLLLGTSEPDGVVSVDLGQFEAAFKSEHEPFEKTMLILCKDCHRKYDLGHVKRGRPTGARVTTGRAGVSASASDGADFLPITLDPSRVDDFKARLLVSKSAELTVLYGDGRTETRLWNASRFSETSNVFGNLRSRPEFRQREWQARGIVKVHVRVRGDAQPSVPAELRHKAGEAR